MIAVTRDAAWATRLDGLSARAGWPLAAVDALPSSDGSASDRTVVVLDRALAGASPARTVAGLRAMFPSARIALACSEAELGADGVAAGLGSGADEVVVKSWGNARLSAMFSALRDAALAAAVRVSVDGVLKAELRSHRAFVRARARWSELPLPAAEFALLWTLLGAEGEAVPRERLLDALRAVSGRDVEAETVSRRALSLRRALAPWKGTVETVRGGFYRLASSRRRSST
ncbi:MAG: response regulator transcription factor [Elusimicrobia bacterium]|nr:response regulator transcription factor [Elusimicrobiota bacterium]